MPFARNQSEVARQDVMLTPQGPIELYRRDSNGRELSLEAEKISRLSCKYKNDKRRQYRQILRGEHGGSGCVQFCDDYDYVEPRQSHRLAMHSQRNNSNNSNSSNRRYTSYNNGHNGRDYRDYSNNYSTYDRKRNNSSRRREKYYDKSGCVAKTNNHMTISGDKIVEKHPTRSYVYHRQPFDWYNTCNVEILDDIEEVIPVPGTLAKPHTKSICEPPSICSSSSMYNRHMADMSDYDDEDDQTEDEYSYRRPRQYSPYDKGNNNSHRRYKEKRNPENSAMNYGRKMSRSRNRRTNSRNGGNNNCKYYDDCDENLSSSFNNEDDNENVYRYRGNVYYDDDYDCYDDDDDADEIDYRRARRSRGSLSEARAQRGSRSVQGRERMRHAAARSPRNNRNRSFENDDDEVVISDDSQKIVIMRKCRNGDKRSSQRSSKRDYRHSKSNHPSDNESEECNAYRSSTRHKSKQASIGRDTTMLNDRNAAATAAAASAVYDDDERDDYVGISGGSGSAGGSAAAMFNSENEDSSNGYANKRDRNKSRRSSNENGLESRRGTIYDESNSGGGGAGAGAGGGYDDQVYSSDMNNKNKNSSKSKKNI